MRVFFKNEIICDQVLTNRFVTGASELRLTFFQKIAAKLKGKICGNRTEL